MGAAVATLDLLRDEPTLATQVVEKAAMVRTALREQGWTIPSGRTPIIPILLGEEAIALELAKRLRLAGHYAPAIRPPTVPEGGCRLRITVTLAHTTSDCRRLIKTMATLRPAMPS
jgi:8-amino-7-oxononanoate synthase